VTVDKVRQIEFKALNKATKWILSDNAGYAPGAPYSAIHVGAAAPFIPALLIEQLAHPGRMFIPVEDGDMEGGQSIWQVDKDDLGNVTRQRLMGVRVSNYSPICKKS